MSLIFKRSVFGCMLSVLLFLACAKDDSVLDPFDQPLVVEIISGPESGSTISNNAHFTFEWRTRGGGNVSFAIQLSGVDAQPITTTETSKAYPGLHEGNYTFTVTASAGSQNANTSRAFTVGPNLGPPQVLITGPRGSTSTPGSGVIPAYAPGATAFFRWTGTDVDRFGTITGYRWRIAAGQPFNEFNLGTVAGFAVPSTPGTHTFTLEAKDNAGAVSTTNFSYEVKSAAILIVDDKSQANPLVEIDEDGFYAALFEGYAFANWDVAQRGAPGAADFAGLQVVVIYSGVASALWRKIGADYPETSAPLADFVSAGGRLWAIGQEILEDLSQANHTNPPAASEFEVQILHLAPATGDTNIDRTRKWDRAGATTGDGKFSFADNRLGKPSTFPRIAIDVQTGDVDKIVPGDGAEIIYGGTDGLGGFIGNVALRFPSGGTNTQVVFQAFPFHENAVVKASLIDTRTVVQEIMSEMRQ
ncbi:MAG: hypothetical protein ACREOI_16110 [bacterium]